MRTIVLALVAIATTTGFALGAEKNVILFVTDDQGCDAGCYGNPVIKTPNMDRLAAEGTLFPYAFATTASCSASRSVILTGLFNHANAQYGHMHSYHHFTTYDKVKSLPVLLGSAGYRTASIGKFHVAPEKIYHFDTYLKGNSRNAVEMAEKSKDFIGAKSDKPFFLYFCTSDPHRGGGTADDLPGKPNRFGNGKDYPGVKEVVYDPKDVIVPPFLPDTLECRAELAQYYQSVSRIDQGLGRLIEILKETGHWDDTLILYISDHGIAFPGGKTTVYEPGLRCPCIVRDPYVKKKDVVCNAMVSWIDITPTILDFANATPTKYKFQGRSFLSILDKENPKGWDDINASHTFHEITMYYPMRVVRDRKHKLIWNIAYPLPYPFASDLWAAPTWQSVWKDGPDAKYGQRSVKDYIQRPEFELYDLEKDPNESKNLADDPAYGSLLDEMKGKLKKFQNKTKDPWVLKWTYE
ncbi:Arylsulfatase [Planctomycetes bacterium Pan216]|uniref:Arylsulfatase n=1 Tax=Kolteria novifilia TaxID=2527975 RepID=A0A518B474_9BACT|nr:Arylsulfatase [Planctomycetes bacterium Pan216]